MTASPDPIAALREHFQSDGLWRDDDMVKILSSSPGWRDELGQACLDAACPRLSEAAHCFFIGEPISQERRRLRPDIATRVWQGGRAKPVASSPLHGR
ncbi:hypothetical protein PO883_22250 [Massilia sp. DJPM01]|uniref:hypothetical protein n=1 Tax=Massilia sp. DJPM01 TaxID=3024404 RepID=UPI00259D4664|nr:hypothetical protein [Massilia sp. DJPM01]MDM5179918.1 hypothetical protein [Massilia sp. DJPM01]